MAFFQTISIMQTILSINGQKHKAEFNYQAIKAYEKETGKSYFLLAHEITSGEIQVTTVVSMAYAALIGAGAMVDINELAKQVFKMTEEELTALYMLFFESVQTDEKEPAAKENGKALEAADTGK